MKLTKRFLAALLAAVMLVIALPVLGVSAAEESVVLTLDENTFKRSSERNGTFVDGRLEFYKNESIKSTLNLSENLELTPGDKVARIYLRAPQKIAGQFEFFKFSVKSGGQDKITKALKGNDFTASPSKSMIYEIAFIVNDGETVALSIDYNGSFNIIIDRIEVVAAGTATADQVVAKEGETTGSVDTYTITADDLAGVTMIDSLSIARGDTNVMLPASYLSAWFEAGYTKATVTFSSATPELQKRLATKMNSYNAKNYMVTIFDFDLVLTDASGKDVEVTTLPGTITMKSVVPKRITSKFTEGARKLCIAYQNSEDSSKDNGSIGSLAKVDGKVIATTGVSETGTVLIAAACMK